MKTDIIQILSRTEVRVASFLEKGYSNKLISSHCNISENTVKFHLKNIYKKLEVHNRMEAIYKINQKN